MGKNSIVLLGIIFLLFACEKKQTGQLRPFEIIIADSFKIDYMGSITAADFQNMEGVLYDPNQNSLVKFDHEGNILYQKEIPTEGPNSFRNVMSLKLDQNGELLIHTLRGRIFILSKSLAFIKEIKPEFINQLRSMSYNSKVINKWKDDYIIDFYPGRDGASPYQHEFFKNNFLMEKFSIQGSSSEPILKIAQESKYNSSLYFEQPSIVTAIHEDYLYFAFSNEPKIYEYDLQTNQLNRTYQFNPSKFTALAGQDKP